MSQTLAFSSDSQISSFNPILPFRLELLKAERGDQLFPDEVDTPLDVPARVRFARQDVVTCIFSPLPVCSCLATL